MGVGRKDNSEMGVYMFECNYKALNGKCCPLHCVTESNAKKTSLSFVQIDFDNCLDGNTRVGVYITVDGTDFQIKKPSPFPSTW